MYILCTKNDTERKPSISQGYFLIQQLYHIGSHDYIYSALLL